MKFYWKCISYEGYPYDGEKEYLTDPSFESLVKFRREITSFEDPTSHKAYEFCEHAEKTSGLSLFIIDGRLEVLLKINRDARTLEFAHCSDV